MLYKYSSSVDWQCFITDRFIKLMTIKRHQGLKDTNMAEEDKYVQRKNNYIMSLPYLLSASFAFGFVRTAKRNPKNTWTWISNYDLLTEHTAKHALVSETAMHLCEMIYNTIQMIIIYSKTHLTEGSPCVWVLADSLSALCMCNEQLTPHLCLVNQLKHSPVRWI